MQKLFIPPCHNDHYGFKHKDIDFQGRLHPGYDYNGKGAGNADLGTPLVAIADGVVTFVSHGTNGGWGNMVVYKLDMHSLFQSKSMEMPEWCPRWIWVKSAHLSEIDVSEGQEIKQGEEIGNMGGTPYWSSHLHWDMKIRSNGVFYYPPKGISEEEFDSIYLDNEKFMAQVNEYIAIANTSMPDIGLIKLVGKPDVYYYNGVGAFHIPDWFTFETLFGDSEIQEIEKDIMKKIKLEQSFPSLKP